MIEDIPPLAPDAESVPIDLYSAEVDAIIAKRAWNAEKDIASAVESHAAIFHGGDPVPDRDTHAVFRAAQVMPVWLAVAKFAGGTN